MKLFTCHVVMPLSRHDRTHVVKTYVVAAPCWQMARTRVRDEEPGAEFVTVPVEKPIVLLAEFASMSERELADLRSACNWHEEQIARNGASAWHAAQPTLGPES